MYVKDLYVTSIIPVSDSSSYEEAFRSMRNIGVSSLPVIDMNNNYLGLVSSTKKSIIKNATISENQSYITNQDIFVYPHQHILEVLELFLENTSLIIPIIDENKKYLGTISHNEIMKWLTSISSITIPGAIIVISIDMRDYVLSEISQIIESNNSKILFLYIELDEDSTHADLTLKLNNTEINSIIQTLERYSYTIKMYFSDSNQLSEMYKERVEELLNFINI